MKNDKILLELSIPQNASKVGKMFLEFCVNEFGGKSKLFREPQLSTEQLKDLIDRLIIFLETKEIKKGVHFTDSRDLLYVRDLGSCGEGDKFIGFYFEFVSEKQLDKKEEDELAISFLRKVFQLFEQVNKAEQNSNFWRRLSESIRKSYEPRPNPPLSANHLLFEKDS